MVVIDHIFDPSRVRVVIKVALAVYPFCSISGPIEGLNHLLMVAANRWGQRNMRMRMTLISTIAEYNYGLDTLPTLNITSREEISIN